MEIIAVLNVIDSMTMRQFSEFLEVSQLCFMP